VRKRIALCILLVSGLVLVALGPAAADRTLTVFGAASLTEFLQAAKPVFEKAHPEVTVRLNLAASSRCRIQIEHGAPCDVLLSANTKNMEPLVEAGIARDPIMFAYNKVVIIAPRSNPGGLQTPADLAKPGLKLVTCSPEVPIGRYTRTAIEKMDASGEYGDRFKQRVLANIVSEEPNVKGIVAKVLLGEADGGMCYASDVTAAVRPKVKTIGIPDEANVVADYPIAVLNGSSEDALAETFVEFVLSEDGQKLLAHHGFIPLGPPKQGSAG